MNKILVLSENDDFTLEAFKNEKVDIGFIRRKQCILLRVIKRMFYYCGYRMFSLFLPFKEMDIEKYELVIIFQCQYADKVIKYIRKKNKKCLIVYWLWNTVEKMDTVSTPRGMSNKESFFKLKKLESDEDYRFNIWSFDKGDCVKYGLNFNNQIGYKMNIKKDLELKGDVDVFFIGRDKGRSDLILSIVEVLKKHNLKYHVNILDSVVNDYGDRNIKKIDKLMSYENVIKNINRSKCILDIVQDEQGGLTWRPLEALFYKKKLITNMRDIKTYDFYIKENIFIIGYDDYDSLNEFINSPYVDVDEKIVQGYQFQGWIEKFK